MAGIFKKGERVTYVADWDSRGTFYFIQAFVHSCGGKKVVLYNAETQQLLGRHFRPEIGIIQGVGRQTNGIFKQMSDDEAHAVCLAEAASYLAWRRQTIADSIEKSASGSLYAKAMEKQLAELHEPMSMKGAVPQV